MKKGVAGTRAYRGIMFVIMSNLSGTQPCNPMNDVYL